LLCSDYLYDLLFYYSDYYLLLVIILYMTLIKYINNDT